MLSSNAVRPRVARFGIGRKMVTRAARDTLVGQSVMDCFARHERGDFGDVDAEDYEANLDAISDGLRIVSVYQCDTKRGDTTKIYVITEADRSVTTLLLAEDY